MPCFTISSIEVDAGKMQVDLARAALAEMGLSPRTNAAQPGIVYHNAGSFNTTNGKAQWYSQDRTNELKRAYAAEIIKSQAKRYGWTLRQSTTDRYAYTITKR